MNNIRNYLRAKLTQDGYDGLCFPGECSCTLDDLCWCQSPNELECCPGYLHETGNMYPNKEPLDDWGEAVEEERVVK